MSAIDLSNGALLVEKELSDSNRSVSFAQTSAPGIINSWDFEDVSKKTYGRLSAGLTAGVTDAAFALIVKSAVL